MNMGVDYRGGTPHGFANDAAFPFRDELFDEARLLSELRAALPGEELAGPTEIVGVGYVPGRELTAVVTVRVGAHRRTITVEGVPAPSTAGSGLPTWNAHARVFPDDPVLHGARKLATPAEASAVLSRVLGGGPPVRAVQLISSLPGTRCVIRLDTEAGSVFAKIAAGVDPAAGDRRLRALWEDPTRTFAMPEPLGCDATIGARFERGAMGIPVDGAFDRLDVRALVDALGPALANLHSLGEHSTGDQPRVNGSAQVLRRIERKIARRVRMVVPREAARVDALVAALARMRQGLPHLVPTTIHGDLHTANVLVDAGTPTLIDLDDIALGDPEFDLALFTTRLFVTALVRDANVEAAAHAIAYLPLAYRAAGGRPIEASVYRWYVAATLLGRQAKTLVRHLTPGAATAIAALVTVAEAVLDDGPDAEVILGALGPAHALPLVSHPPA